MIVGHLGFFFRDSFAQTLQKTAIADQTDFGTSCRFGNFRGLCELYLLKLASKESSMGSTADKVKGATNEAVGKAKQGVGEAIGSDRLQGEGAVQEVKGKGQKAVGDAKEAAKDAANRAAAAANKNL
jgi:uncharacterized protein YjbJ (UPF0337 family)